MSAHSHFAQGQKVFVQLKSGEKFEDKFFERRSTHVVLQQRGRVPMSNVRAISVKRGT